MTYDTIIIGAGISGLITAYELQNQGYENILLVEAQDYVGGRMKTWDGWGSPLDLGAEFLHGTHIATWPYIERFGLKTIPAYGERELFMSTGAPLSPKERRDYTKLFLHLQATAKHGESIQDNLLRSHITSNREVIQLAAMAIADYEAGDADGLDSWSYAEMERLTEDNGKAYVMEYGYYDLIKKLCEDLNIRTSTPIESVDYSGPLAALTTTDGERLIAKHVVITASIGVLQAQKIRFIPELPDDYHRTITRLGMGNAMKLLLRFKSPHDVKKIRIANGENGLLDTITCWWRSGSDQHVLVGYTCGRRAQYALSLPSEELVDQSLRSLEKIGYEHLRRELLDYKIVRWDTNEYTLGAYSNHPVGVSHDERRVFQQSINEKLFFAGEATVVSGNYATVHGAIESGQRVARQLLDLY